MKTWIERTEIMIDRIDDVRFSQDGKWTFAAKPGCTGIITQRGAGLLPRIPSLINLSIWRSGAPSERFAAVEWTWRFLESIFPNVC